MRSETIVMKRCFTLFLVACMLTGCGLAQNVSDGTASVVKAVFYRQVNTLHLDFVARAALNPDEDGMPLVTEVWVYQLKDRQAFDKADYAGLQSDAHSVLSADLLAERDIQVRPGSTISLDMPLDDKAQYVGLVAQFRTPDARKNDWRLVLMRGELDPDKARTLVLKEDSMTLKSPGAE